MGGDYKRLSNKVPYCLERMFSLEGLEPTTLRSKVESPSHIVMPTLLVT